MNRLSVISTTSRLDGWSVESYLGVVSCQMVIGANIFTDVFASFRDVFGGNVKSYQKELEKMEAAALRDVEKKALALGGNVILGLKMDFDEISGGGKSMFMLSVVGTAAIARNEAGENTSTELTVSSDELKHELEREKMLAKVNAGEFNVESVADLQKLSQLEIQSFDVLLGFLSKTSEHSENVSLAASEYLKKFDSKLIAESLSRVTKINGMTLRRLIATFKSAQCVDYPSLISLLHEGNNVQKSIAINLASLDKERYSASDIDALEAIIAAIEANSSHFPRLETGKGMLGKSKSYWVCPVCEKRNDSSLQQCDAYSCNAKPDGLIIPGIDAKRLSGLLTKKVVKLKEIFLI